jgi:hypothetical protein
MNKKTISLNTVKTALSRFAVLSLLAFSASVAAAPPVPTLSSPYSGQPNVPLTTTFTWSSSGFGVSYRIIVSHNSSFSGFNSATGTCDSTCATATLTGTSHTRTLNFAGKTYYWKVRAFNATGTSLFSNYRSFTTAGVAVSPLSAKVDAFVSQWTGTKVEFDGVMGDYAYQCTDLVHKYAQDVLGLNGYLAKGNAYTIFTNTNSSKFTKIKNSPTGVPQKGDIIFWKQSGSTYNPGHVAIFISGDTNTFTSFDQNWPLKSAPKKVTHHYVGSGELGGVVGWLHPNL